MLTDREIDIINKQEEPEQEMTGNDQTICHDQNTSHELLSHLSPQAIYFTQSIFIKKTVKISKNNLGEVEDQSWAHLNQDPQQMHLQQQKPDQEISPRSQAIKSILRHPNTSPRNQEKKSVTWNLNSDLFLFGEKNKNQKQNSNKITHQDSIRIQNAYLNFFSDIESWEYIIEHPARSNLTKVLLEMLIYLKNQHHTQASPLEKIKDILFYLEENSSSFEKHIFIKENIDYLASVNLSSKKKSSMTELQVLQDKLKNTFQLYLDEVLEAMYHFSDTNSYGQQKSFSEYQSLCETFCLQNNRACPQLDKKIQKPF